MGMGFQIPPGGLEAFVKPDGYLNQQGAICARSSYWLRIVVGLHRCDAGGRFARCVVVIRIGLTLSDHGYASEWLRQAPCKVSVRCALHREDRAVIARLSCYTPHFPAPSWFYSPHAEFCFPAAPVTRCRRKRSVTQQPCSQPPSYAARLPALPRRLRWYSRAPH